MFLRSCFSTSQSLRKTVIAIWLFTKQGWNGLQIRYTKKVGLALFVASFLAPFYVRIQPQHFGDVMVVVVGPCWQYIWRDSPYFEFSPIPLLIFFPFWGPGLLIAKIAYDTARIQDLSRHHYIKKVVRVIFLQMLFLVFLVLPSTGYPEPIAIPLPVVGMAALLLTRVIVKEIEEPWEE